MTYLYPPSPESEVFSTPPTSPMPIHVDSAIARSGIGGRGGRPAQLLLDPSKTKFDGFQPAIELEGSSLVHSTSIPDIREQTAVRTLSATAMNETALKSPCFVHSQLEKGASLVDWLKHTHIKGDISVAKSLGSPPQATTSPADSWPVGEDEEDEAFSRSLTRQLAETAVGVREMSKALGEWRTCSLPSVMLTVTC
jgi:NAD+ kinase